MNDKIISSVKFLFPLGVWCVLTFPLFQHSLISSETLHIYSVIKFYIENLKMGVFPMWDPFVMWGGPTQIYLNYAGVFNPFWLLIVVLNAIGISFYHAFVVVLTLYFLLGIFGFYLLSKLVLKDESAAYVSFLLFLFSSISMSMFAQFHAPMIYIPAIWFFYFVLSFLNVPSRKTLIGATFASALILTSYLPFYFLTVTIILCVLLSFLYFFRFKMIFQRAFLFLSKNVLIFILCLGVLLVATMPGFFAYLGTARGDITAPFRNQEIVPGAGVHFMEYKKVSKNGFGNRMELQDLYADLDLIPYGDDCFFYVSIFLYIIMIMGFWIRFNKVMIVCGLTALILFFLIMASGTGFHRYVFEHVSFFRLIRNMHFFLPFFIMALVLLAAEQFRVITENIEKLSSKKHIFCVLGVIVAHAGIGIFLLQQENIISSSFWGLVASFIFWLTIIFHKKQNSPNFLTLFLLVVIIVQPVEVIWRHHQRGIQSYLSNKQNLLNECVRVNSVRPGFVYERPLSSRQIGNDDTAYSRIAMKDASRFFENGFPTAWSYQLALKKPFVDVQEYTAFKFYVYDRIAVEEGKDHLTAEEDRLSFSPDIPLVAVFNNHKELEGLAQKRRSMEKTPGSMISGASQNFRVIGFDVNSIGFETSYHEEKFLVYNDSYHKDWQAFINGQLSPIYRTNIAFKGLRLPAGKNVVYLRYEPQGLKYLSIVLAFSMMMLLASLIFLTYQERHAKNNS